jgi:hypothetical protein
MPNEVSIITADAFGTRGKELAELMNKCDKPGASERDLAALRRALIELPDLWRVTGDLAHLAQNKLMDGLIPQPTMRESVEHALKVQRDELAPAGASPIERLLAEQVVTSWLQLYLTQYLFAAIHSGESVTLTRSEYWDKRLSAAQRRYLLALETLAKVKRLLHLGAVQVNIGAQQVNVMGETKPAKDGK